MRPLRALIIDDDEAWRDLIRISLEGLEIEFDTVATTGEAERLSSDRAYDLVTVDLSPAGPANSPDRAGEERFQLFERIRRNRHRRPAAILVVTGHAGFERFPDLLRFRQAHRLLTKREFLPEKLEAAAREALREARLAYAEERAWTGTGRELTIRFLEDCWVGCRLSGPQKADYFASRPLPFDSSEFARGGEHLRLLIARWAGSDSGSAIWRPSAQTLGRSLFEELSQDRDIRSSLDVARGAAPEEGPLTLRLVGPTGGLRVPFELLRDDADHLCFTHPIVRQLSGKDIPWNHREPSLGRFVHALVERDEALHVVLVGAAAATTEAPLASVERELKQVEETARLELERRQGLRLRMTTIIGDEATPERVKGALEEGAHVLHYAGHGGFDAASPELSGLVLWKDGLPRTLSAAELKRLADGGELRLVFLNSCQAARTAADREQGDFHGTLEAMVKAGVPWILGHRWPVLDESACHFARFFYQVLWRSFDPALAVLEARRLVAEEEPWKRNDPIWASSILVSQSG